MSLWIRILQNYENSRYSPIYGMNHKIYSLSHYTSDLYVIRYIQSSGGTGADSSLRLCNNQS